MNTATHSLHEDGGTLGCALSSPWMCGIADLAHGDGSIVRAKSNPSHMAINNRKTGDTALTSTVSPLTASVPAFEDDSFHPITADVFCRAIWFCIPCADMAAGEMCRNRVYSET